MGRGLIRQAIGSGQGAVGREQDPVSGSHKRYLATHGNRKKPGLKATKSSEPTSADSQSSAFTSTESGFQ